MIDWKETLLGDIITLQRGFDLTEKETTPGPYPVISSSGVSYTTAVPRVSGPGVVTGRKGLLGKVHFSIGPYWPHDTTLWVKDFKDSDPRFIYYLLQTLPLASLDAGASNPTLNRNHAHLLPVRVPPLETQIRISETLGTIDDLIQNNLRRADVLVGTARAIYREWFVRFRYPGHEEATFVASSTGHLPEGWLVEPLINSVTRLTDGDWIETKDQGGADYRLLQVSNIGLGSFRETGNYRYVTKETFDRLRCTAISIGDILVSRMPDPVGRAWLVDFLDVPAITAVDVAILSPVSKSMGSYLREVLNSAEHLSHMATVATGTTRKRVTRSVLSQSPIRIPPKSLLEAFHDSTKDLTSLVSALRRSSAKLSEIRDLLLPKVMSGKIDISMLDLDTV